MKKTSLLLIGLMALPLGSCTLLGAATGVGASLGVAASQEGGLSRAASDLRIQAEINDLWFRSNVDSFVKLDMTVNQGRVLVTGVVQDPEERVEAIRLAWLPEGVKQVINEVQVADSEGILGYAKDSWITTRIRTAITLDRDIQSINYSIDTVQGVVYLIGAAQNQLELNRVIETARTIPNVKRVVSYVKLVGQSISDSATSSRYQESETYGSDLNNDEYDMPQGYDGTPSDDQIETDLPPSGYGEATGNPQPLIESERLN